MKLINFVLGLALIVGLAFGVGSAKAAALTYESCFQVQNLEAAQASITISYYQQGVATSTDVTDTIPASGSKTYCPLNAVANGFNGSVVISSDKQIAAIANVTGQGWSGFDASYAGFSAGATTVNVPLLMKGNYNFNTWFNVQNAGGTGPANVTVAYSDGTTATGTIDPNQAKTFDQATESHSATVFAATVTSNQPIVVTVMEVGPTMLFAYNGFTTSVTNPMMPLVQANNYGYTTGIQIQNSGDAASDVVVTYTPSAAGTQCTETHNIPAHASVTYALNAWSSTDPDAAHNTCTNGQTFIGSAQVTSNSAGTGLAAIINQQNFGGNKGAAYGSFDSATAGTTVVLPLIMDRNYGYFTGFNIMNVGTGSVDVNCTFTGSSYTAHATLTAGAAMTDVQVNKIADKYVGSATCVATGTGAKIVGVVNELLNAGSTDTFLVYEAFSK